VGHRKEQATVRQQLAEASVEAERARADGHDLSTSTVERALRRRGVLLPRGFRADRKSWAALHRKVFHDPPTERNRVWQTDFSEFEITGGGIWRICAVIDYATKYCLAITITPTGRGSVRSPACAPPSPRPNASSSSMTYAMTEANPNSWTKTAAIIDVVPAPIAVVSNNGSCFRGEIYQTAFAGDDPLLRHVRTRVRSPQSNGVIERFFGTLKYEHLYRARVGDGGGLAMETSRFCDIYARIRPHQSLGDRTPRDAYLGVTGRASV
jgi:putative transposase